MPAKIQKQYCYLHYNRQYTNIVFILQYNLPNKMLFNLIIKKKDNANPIDTSIVVPVRGVAQ
jgi:hypothetical protein